MDQYTGFTDSFSSGISGISEGYGQSDRPEHMASRRSFIEVLQTNYKLIKADLYPDDKIVDALYQDRFISQECREMVWTLKVDPKRANDVIIKGLVRNLEKLDDSLCDSKVAELYQIFKTYKWNYLLGDEHRRSSVGCAQSLDCPRATLTVKEMRQLLRNQTNRRLLEDELEPRRIIDDLLEAGVLTFNDHEDIMITCCRLERVTSLIKYIKKDILKKCPAFLIAVRSCNTMLGKRLVENLMAGKNETEQKQLEISVQKQDDVITTCIKVPPGCNVDVSLKLRFLGKDGEVTAVEHGIVDMAINQELETMAMECDTSVEALSFSSVVLRLRLYTQRAAHKLTEMIKEPEGLRRWLASLLSDEQKLQLKEAALNSITIEIKTTPQTLKQDKDCHCLLSKKSIAKDGKATLLQDTIRDLNPILTSMYDMSCFGYVQRKEMVRLINIAGQDEKVNAFRDFLLTLHGEQLCSFEIALRTTENADVLEHLSDEDPDGNPMKRNHANIRRCTSMTSHCTLEKSLLALDVEPIEQIGVFLTQLDVSGLDAKLLDRINVIREMDDDIVKTQHTLRLLLQLPQSCICQFERFLKETDQTNTLRHLKEHNDLLVLGDITKDEIVENLTLLCDVIDPRVFDNLLAEPMQQTVSSYPRRQQRARTFFQSILESESCDLYIRRFVAQLHQRKMYHIIKILNSSKRSKNLERARVNGDILKHKLLENKDLLADEVDIHMLRSTFVDRRIVTDEGFSALASKGSRKESVVALLKQVLDQGYPAMICLVAALKIGGYSYVAGCIENTTDEVLMCPCEAPPIVPQTFLDTTFSVQITTVDEGHVVLDSSDTTRRGSIQTSDSNDITVKPHVDNPDDKDSPTGCQEDHDQFDKKRKETVVDKEDYVKKWLENCTDTVTMNENTHHPPAVVNLNRINTHTPLSAETVPDSCFKAIETSISILRRPKRYSNPGERRVHHFNSKQIEKKRRPKTEKHKSANIPVYNYLSLGYSQHTVRS